MRVVSPVVALIVIVAVTLLLAVLVLSFISNYTTSTLYEERVTIVYAGFHYIMQTSLHCKEPPCGYIVALVDVKGQPPVYEIRAAGLTWRPSDCAWYTKSGVGVLDPGFNIILIGDYLLSSKGCMVVSETGDKSKYDLVYRVYYSNPEKYLGRYLVRSTGFAIHPKDLNQPFIIVSRSIYRHPVKVRFLGTIG